MYKELFPINEVSYLHAENATIYRTIMRELYLANESYQTKLYKEDIFELVKEKLGNSYTIDNLKLHLNALVEWGNLVAFQDPGLVRTIAEYKNKQYRYSLSERAVEIERMSIKLENLQVESASLSGNYFVRIEEALNKTELIYSENYQEINSWWHMLLNDFKSLNYNYNDYLREFYTGEALTIMKSVEFIIHKDKFIMYLRNFIKQMQINSRLIATLIKEKDEIFINGLLDKIVQSELEVPQIHSEGRSKDLIKEHVNRQYASFKSWFIPINGKTPECERILEITNEVIRNIIENANLIVQTSNFGISRKDDYRHYLQLYSNCKNIDEAHCLSAQTFGISKINHYKMNGIDRDIPVRTSEFDIDHDIFDLKTRSKNYTRERNNSSFETDEIAKQAQALEYFEQIAKKNKYLEKFIKGRSLKINEINEIVEPFFRQELMLWISYANTNDSKQGRTGSGRKFVLKRNDGECVLRCKDGDLMMPNFELEFMDE